MVPAKQRLVPDTRNRRTDALSRLGLTAEQAAVLPRVTSQLESAEHGIPQVLESLRASEDPDAIAFVAQYDKVSPSDKQRVSLEEIAHAASLTPLRLLEISTSALFKYSQTVGAIIAATSHPEVIKKTVQMALQDKGTKDREMIHLAQGFLPTPKGATTVNRIQIANLGGRSTVQAAEESEETDAFPSMEEEMTSLHELRVKMLTAGK